MCVATDDSTQIKRELTEEEVLDILNTSDMHNDTPSPLDKNKYVFFFVCVLFCFACMCLKCAMFCGIETQLHSKQKKTKKKMKT